MYECSTYLVTQSTGTNNKGLSHLAASFATWPSICGRAPAPLSLAIPGTQAVTQWIMGVRWFQLSTPFRPSTPQIIKFYPLHWQWKLTNSSCSSIINLEHSLVLDSEL